MIRPLALGCFVACSLAACGDTEDPSAADSSSGSTSGESTGTTTDATTVDPVVTGDDTTADPGTTEAPTTDPTTGEATSDPTTTTDPLTTGDTTTSTGDDTTGDTTGEDTTTDGTTGDELVPPELPAATMECPQLIDGMVEFKPDGVASPRMVRIWMDPELVEELDGPVVFYWHGTGGEPEEAVSGLGELGIQEILDQGGIVIAPTHDPGAGIFPWHLVLSEKMDDLLIADEVLACAQEQFGVDATRVHSLGFSAGALHTAQMSIRRSSYLASVALYSGGLIFGSMPMFELPDNKFAAMIFHGGAGDQVVVGFKQASEDYAKYLATNEHFSFICDHGGGHSIPDAQDSVMQFMHEHPFGTAPEPYLNALPNGFPDYCVLP